VKDAEREWPRIGITHTDDGWWVWCDDCDRPLNDRAHQSRPSAEELRDAHESAHQAMEAAERAEAAEQEVER
jgi:hypothetical protein